MGLALSVHGIGGGGNGVGRRQGTGVMTGGAGRDAEDGPRPTLVPNAASWLTIPFKVLKFVHWAPIISYRVTKKRRLIIEIKINQEVVN